MKRNRIAFLTLMAGVALLGFSNATAQNLIVNGDFGAGNLTGWTTVVTTPTTITYDVATGSPSGSALLARNNSAAAVNGNYLYQIIPVVNGAQYQLNAQWKSDLLNGGTGRNWAEVMISFVSTNVGPPTFTIQYKKGVSTGPNEPSTHGWAWESVLLSPDPKNAAAPTNGIFTATADYMVVGFNLGGHAGAGPGRYNIDNVSITPCSPTNAPVSGH